MRKTGEQAPHVGRHGHPTKLRGEVRQWLEETCRQAPYTPSHEIQTHLTERFSLTVSVSQINRVRAALGISNPPQSAKRKVSSPAGKQDWQEGVGGLLLLAAAQETALLSQLEKALPMRQNARDISQASTRRHFQPQQSLLLTLLFLNAVGLRRMWDLRSYTGRELALLTGRPQPYSYRQSERFLFNLAAAHAGEALTIALARSYAHATWLRLLPFFQLPGGVHWDQEVAHVELRPFNNRQLNRDLLAVCQRVKEIQPRLPDGRLLILHAPSSPFG